MGYTKTAIFNFKQNENDVTKYYIQPTKTVLLKIPLKSISMIGKDTKKVFSPNKNLGVSCACAFETHHGQFNCFLTFYDQSVKNKRFDSGSKFLQCTVNTFNEAENSSFYKFDYFLICTVMFHFLSHVRFLQTYL